ncbi:hypothetical protein NRB20_75080 [Nocardia sp. RB20]|uniref:PPE family domain-containing protein n=2 Tax=Nocardia macrotermitis TaxID=2585198 RepID=A0A7K0DEZ8_9NOCA|nr:hypothetical protein [Nocardia macrotermitis]
MGFDTPTPDNPSLAAELVQWAQSRAEVAKTHDTAAAADKLIATHGNDPDYMPSSVVEAFVSMSHQDILNAVNDMKPGTMHSSAEAWRKTADALMFNTMGLTSKVQKTLSDGWEGVTAEAISSATRRFTDQMTDVHNLTQSVAFRIESAAYGAETVKGAVPSIPTAPGKPAVPGAENPAAVIGHLTAASDAEQAARLAMTQYYVPSYQPAGQQIPVYVPPTGPYGATGPTLPGVSKPHSATGPGPQPSSGTKPTKNSDPTAGQQNNAEHKNPSNTDPSASNNSAQRDTSPTTHTDPDATSTAGVNPSTTTQDSAPNWTGPGAGLGSESSTPGPNAPGRSVPGTPGTIGTLAGATAAASRPATTPGTSAMPGMAAPGKDKKNDEKEHKGRPELLAHKRNKIDLVGDPILSTPPVFGNAVRASDERSGKDDRPRTDEDNRRR